MSSTPKVYSPNPEINEAILNLLAIGCPPIPVAPKQDPYKPGCHQVDFSQAYRITFYPGENGEEVSARSYCLDARLVKVNGQIDPVTGNLIENWHDRGVYCPLSCDLKPIPKFTGKNPSYLDWKGNARICKHGEFQKRFPTEEELRKFFRNPATGVGTLGGHAGVDWIDFDAKNFYTQDECDHSVQDLINEYGLGDSWIEVTGSGGWRIAVKPKQHPTFTNFALSPGGEHIGEALWKGRFTVLAPSIHPNGKSYHRLGWGEPIEVESLEAIGIFPSKDEVENQKQKQKQKKTTNTEKKNKQRKTAAHQNYDKQTKEITRPWDIRNFAIYFDGYYESNEWGYARCPHHNGTSMRSFRVSLKTGQYKLHCGCNTKDVYKSGIELAKSRGFSLPKHNKPSSLPAQVDEETWNLKFGLPKLLNKLTNKLVKSFQGFGKPKDNATPDTSSNKKQWNNHRLISRADIQTPDVYKNEGSPLLMYRPGDMAYIWQAARYKGYKAVVDTSLTGEGKSETVGRQKTDNWFLNIEHDEKGNSRQKLFYASESGTNTTAPSLESWSPLARRHDGLITRPDKLTGGGNPFIERPKAGEVPTIPGNCHLTKLHHILGSKNIGVGGSRSYHSKDKIGDSNPICNICSQLNNCKATGFKSERQESLKNSRIKGTISSFPDAIDADFQVVGFVDEAGSTIKECKEISAKLVDVEKAFFRLYQRNKELYDKLEFIYGILTTYLSEQKPPKYGYDIATIKSWFGERFDSLDFSIAVNHLETLTNNVTREELEKIANEHQGSDEINELVTLNWLLPFCRIMEGTLRGSIRISNKEIIVTIPNNHELNTIRSWEFGIFLDATGDRDEFARILGYEPHEILWVMQAPRKDVFSNMPIVQVTGLGKCGKDRRELAKRRIAAINAGIVDWASGKSQNHRLNDLVGKPEDIFPGGFDEERVAFIRHLKFKQSGDLYFFGGASGHRGSNAAQNCQLLILEGLANENLGAALAKYHTIYSKHCTLDDPDFQSWYNRRILAETVQGCGRTRATRRPDQIIPVFILNDADLSGLASQYGMNVCQIDALEVSVEAGNQNQITALKVMRAVQYLREQGAKIVQSAVAEVAGISQPLVSKLAAKLGGWSRLKKLLLVLLNCPTSRSNNSALLDQFSDLEREMMNEYFIPVVEAELGVIEDAGAPEAVAEGIHEIVQAVEGVIKVVGFKGLVKGLGIAPMEIQAKLLALILGEVHYVMDF